MYICVYGVKQDTVNALRTSPVHLNSLFPDYLISKAKEDSDTDSKVASTLMLQVTSRLATLTGNRPSLHGNSL